MKHLLHYSRLFVIGSLLSGVIACNPVGLYEKTAAIPGHSWKSSFKPVFRFTISDSTRPYEVFFIIRHNDSYHYNNIYINLQVKEPGADTVKTVRCDIRLGTNEKGWTGSGMDDIYEQRKSLNEDLVKSNISFRRKGDYEFTIEQIMREDPLENVLNAGLRIEKK